MRCFSDVLKKTLPPDVFGDVLEKVRHLPNDASNDVSRPALPVTQLTKAYGIINWLHWDKMNMEKVKHLVVVLNQ